MSSIVSILSEDLISKVADESLVGEGYIGGALGASMPAASLIQYYLGDYQNAKSVIQTAPVMSPRDLHKKFQRGDLGISGEIKPQGGAPSMLSESSRHMTGSPLGHAFGIGGRKGVWHGGSHHDWAIRSTAGDRFSNIVDSLLKAIEEKKKTSLSGRYGVFQKNLAKSNALTDRLVERVGKKPSLKDINKSLASFIGEADDNHFYMGFRDNNATQSQVGRAVGKMRTEAIKPYSFLAGVKGTVGRLFAPKMEGKPTFCNSAMCGDVVGAATSSYGGGIKGRNLPVDVFSNKNLSPIGIASGKRMAAGKVRDMLMSKLKSSAITRTGLGIGAMGLAGAAGGALEKGVASVGEGINSFLSDHNKVS